MSNTVSNLISACSISHIWPEDKNRERVPNSIYWDECIECGQPIPMIKPGRELIRKRKQPMTREQKLARGKELRVENATAKKLGISLEQYRANRQRENKAEQCIEEGLAIIKSEAS